MRLRRRSSAPTSGHAGSASASACVGNHERRKEWLDKDIDPTARKALVGAAHQQAMEVFRLSREEYFPKVRDQKTKPDPFPCFTNSIDVVAAARQTAAYGSSSPSGRVASAPAAGASGSFGRCTRCTTNARTRSGGSSSHSLRRARSGWASRTRRPT